MEDVLHLFHGRIHVAYLEKMADVEHRIPVAKAVQVYPVVIAFRYNDVGHTEISVNAGLFFRDCPGELGNDFTVLFADEPRFADGPQQLLLPAGEDIRIAGSTEQFLPLLTQHPSHLFRAVRILLTGPGEGFLVPDALGKGSICISHLHNLIHLGDLNSQSLHGPGNLVLVGNKRKRIDPRLIHLQNHIRLRRILVHSPVSALTHLSPGTDVYISVFVHRISN